MKKVQMRMKRKKKLMMLNVHGNANFKKICVVCFRLKLYVEVKLKYDVVTFVTKLITLINRITFFVFQRL